MTRSSKSKPIVVIGTLDTKGKEVEYVKNLIEKYGHKALVIDAGVLGEPLFKPDVSRERVAQAAGTDLSELVAQADTGTAVQTMMKGMEEVIKELYAQGRVDGVISLGGGKGTAIGTAGMRTLPLGVPKVAVTTGASGNTRRYVGSKDIVMFPSITDIVGLNRVNSQMLANAVGAIVGMVETEWEKPLMKRPSVSVTTLGITTPAAMNCQSLLEEAGYEVLVFHATGVGGSAMEELAAAGIIDAILDLATVEVMAEMVGAGLGVPEPGRLLATGLVPRVVCPGAIDMIAFGKCESIPPEYGHRLLYQHTPVLTVMRTSVEENARLGELMAERLNAGRGPIAVLIPSQGFSAYDREGGLFYDPEADRAFVESLQSKLRSGIPCQIVEAHINDQTFAEEAFKALKDLMASSLHQD
jgi:uncharacterized protein (UPF0261 family)